MIFRSLTISLLFLTVFPPQTSLCSEAIEEIRVTATRLNQTPQKTLGNVQVIGSAEIRESQEKEAIDLLKSQPNIHVNQAGGAGGQASIFLRGANSEHTLILIDGVEINDPISPARAANLNNFSLSNVIKIEILKGPQSILYGSDAMGGVVNIVTKPGYSMNEEPVYTGSFEVGRYFSFRESAGLSQSGPGNALSLSVSRTDTQGFSSANRHDGNVEPDGYQNTSFYSRYDYLLNENIDLSLFGWITKSKSELDNFGGPGGDDPNYVSRSSQFLIHPKATVQLFNEFWEQTLSLSLSQNQRKDVNDPDDDHRNTGLKSEFNGRIQKIDWQNSFYFDNDITLISGTEIEKEEGDSLTTTQAPTGSSRSKIPKRSVSTQGFYSQLNAPLLNLETENGVRLDFHEKFGSVFNIKSALAYRLQHRATLGSTRFRVSYATGFKSPSIFQLFSSFGAEELKPETVKAIEAGVVMDTIIDGTPLIFDLSVFRNNYDNLIGFDLTKNVYFNTRKSYSQGIEIASRFDLSKSVELSPSYQYLNTKNLETFNPLPRRTRHRSQIKLTVNYLDRRGSTTLEGNYVGSRDNLMPYRLVNLTTTWTFSKVFEAYLKGRNLFNEKYEEVAGFGTAEISLIAGGSVKL